MCVSSSRSLHVQTFVSLARLMRLAAVATLSIVAPASLLAQDDEQPAHVAIADPATTLDRESDAVDAVAGEPMLTGDRLRTTTGRAEIWFPDATSLALDHFTTVELLSSTRVRQAAGRTIVVFPRGAARLESGPNSYQIDTAAGSVMIDEPGEYKISVRNDGPVPFVSLAVTRGSAQLAAAGRSITVRGGERADASGDDAPTDPEYFNAARLDAFDAWTAARRDERRARTTASQHLPSNLQVYGATFDRYGSWSDEPAYGQVWYPAVAPGWRPYYNGYWRPLPRHGWTWIALEAWGWPTHHYGRWGYRGSRWFWIPDRRWGPAWVSWASAADYVGWCPLGFDNRPVRGFSLSVGHTWAGWVVMPRTHFGARSVQVRRHAMDGRRIPRDTASATHAAAPFTPAYRDVRGRRDEGGRVRSSVPGRDEAVGRYPPTVDRRSDARTAPTRRAHGSDSTRGRPVPDRRSPRDGNERSGIAVQRAAPEPRLSRPDTTPLGERSGSRASQRTGEDGSMDGRGSQAVPLPQVVAPGPSRGSELDRQSPPPTRQEYSRDSSSGRRTAEPASVTPPPTASRGERPPAGRAVPRDSPRGTAEGRASGGGHAEGRGRR